MATLYVLGTPIGNLGDITYRAIEVLKSVSVIACEDTRTTKRLLDHYQITTKTISYHQHSGSLKVDAIIKLLQEGDDVALVTDAGTPGISDPGGMLVEAAHNSAFRVVAIPGPSALIAALSISGLPTDEFEFIGFLPHKKGRQTALKKISASDVTVALYESVHRIEKMLAEMVELEINRPIVVCRELTKKFETVYRGTPYEIQQKLTKEQIKGEFVVIVSPKDYAK